MSDGLTREERLTAVARLMAEGAKLLLAKWKELCPTLEIKDGHPLCHCDGQPHQTQFHSKQNHAKS